MLPLLALLPIIMVIIGLINLALPGVTGLILNATNMPQNIYSLLIEIPRPMWDQGVYGIPALANSTSGAAYNTTGYSGLIGPSMTHLYASSRTAAFALLVFVVIIAALSFFLQNFRIVGEGTAMRILTGTVMAVVFIFLFPPIYDVIAATVNSITYPGPNSIIPPGAIDTILSHAAAVAPNPTTYTFSNSTGTAANITSPQWAGYATWAELSPITRSADWRQQKRS